MAFGTSTNRLFGLTEASGDKDNNQSTMPTGDRLGYGPCTRCVRGEDKRRTRVDSAKGGRRGEEGEERA